MLDDFIFFWGKLVPRDWIKFQIFFNHFIYSVLWILSKNLEIKKLAVVNKFTNVTFVGILRELKNAIRSKKVAIVIKLVCLKII